MAEQIHLHKPSRIWLLLLGVACVLSGCRASPEKQEAKDLQRGDALLQRRDYSRAILEYRNAAQVQPKDAEPYYRLGLAYERMGNPRSAVTAYRQALQKNSKHASAQLKLAQLMAKYGDRQVLTEAEQRLHTLVESPAADSQALDALAVAEFRLGKAEEAARSLEQAVRKYPADLEPAVTLAQLKLRQHDFSAAERVLRDAVHTLPKSAEAAVALGRLFLQTNHPEQGEPELRRALALDPQYAPALLSLALLQTNRNRPDEAEQIYRQLSTNRDADYRHLYGLFLFQHGKAEAALNEFQRLARQSPDDRAARTRLVAAYVALHRTAEAQKVLTAVLNKNSKDTDALLQRAGLYLQSGDLANADHDLEWVIHYRPDSAPAYFEAAIAKRMEGSMQSERRDLLQALALAPSYLPARLALARNYLAVHDYKSALNLVDGAPAQQKSVRELRVERNWALLGQ
jgi:Tfp pilus assembly protein PilF